MVPFEDMDNRGKLQNDGMAPEADAQTSEQIDLNNLTPEQEAELVEAARRRGEEAAERELEAEAAAAAAETDAAAEDPGAVELAQQAAADAQERFLRLQADWENYRKRIAAERIAERDRATEKLVTSLLPVLDDMERACEHASAEAEGDERFSQFVDGVSAIHDKMVGIFAHEGVEVIDPVGEAFDPLMHQAVGRVEDTEAYDETVAQVYQKGYSMGGKVIRSAMVMVAYGGPKRPAEESDGQAAE